MVQTKKLWSYQVPSKDGENFPINSLEFNPDGSQIAIGVGPVILVYNPTNGDLLHSLKGHKETVYTLSYSKDGSTFASGGADNAVIIWTKEGKGILKYTHGDSVQVVLYNPVNEVLASCANSSFGFWSHNHKVVQKHKIESKIGAAAWTDDGLFLAIGMICGKISIRDDNGNEKISITRLAPIWGLDWKPKSIDDGDTDDILVVSCWDKTISFYNLFGEPCYKERSVDFYPCNISLFRGNSELMISSGSDKRTVLYTCDGTRICDLIHGNKWIWTSKVNAACSLIATGDQGGEINIFSLQFNHIFAFNNDRYAYRKNMTDVVIKHIEKEKSIIIRCKDYIKGIAAYNDKLAIQLTSQNIYIYQECDQDGALQYQIKGKISDVTCSILTMTSNHLVLCNEDSLRIFTFTGSLFRKAKFESKISCIRTISGPQSYEYILLGFDDGFIRKIFLDKSFPVDMLQHSKEIRFIDLNWNRKKIGFIEDDNLFVKDLKTKKELLIAKEVTSFAFNYDICDTICFMKKNGTLLVASDQNSVYSCRVNGNIVSFKSSRIYLRNGSNFETLDIPQSNIVQHHLKQKEFNKAYTAACCGVPDHVWSMLANDAMNDLNFAIARKAFNKTKNILYMELINSIESELKQNTKNPSAIERIRKTFQAEIAILDGNHEKAVELFASYGEVERAINIYVDLNLWNEAKVLCGTNKNMDLNEIIRKQAKTEEEANNWKMAANLYLECGDSVKAVRLVGEGKKSDWKGSLRQMAELLPSHESASLEICASLFMASHEYVYAIEIYKKLKNYSKLIQLYTQRQEWTEVKAIIDAHISKVEKHDILPYTGWLAMNDKIEEALQIYWEVNNREQGQHFITEMIHIAVIENRFKDVAYYYYLLATVEARNTMVSFLKIIQIYDLDYKEVVVNCLKQEKGKRNNGKDSTCFYKYMKLSELYHAYNIIYSFCKDPFTNIPPESLFDTSVFVYTILDGTRSDNNNVEGIFQTFVLYTMAKHAQITGAYNVAKFAYKRLSVFHIPCSWRDQIILETLLVQTQPMEDKEELLPFCCRCASYSSLLHKLQDDNNRDDICDSCGHPFIRCSISFEILPLVEFQIDPNLSDEDAIRLIQSPVRVGFSNYNCNDLFIDSITLALEKQQTTTVYEPVKVDYNTLKALQRTEVLVLMPLAPEMKIRCFKNMIPEIGIAVNQKCHKFFREDHYELFYLKEGRCPYTRVQQISNVSTYNPLSTTKF